MFGSDCVTAERYYIYSKLKNAWKPRTQIIPADGDWAAAEFDDEKMISIRNINITFSVLLACLFFLESGCTSYESKVYKGKVVDKQGNPVQNVIVQLCYTGWKWDWNMEGGFPLTMDHPFCSEPVLTGRSGNYKVVFAGPVNTKVFARHKDWIQEQDFIATDNRVVMIRLKEYNRRHAEQAAPKERIFSQRRPGEADPEYYCRVVRKRSGKIDLIYKGQRVTLFQSLLHNGKPLFAVSADYELAESIAEEIRITKPASAGGEVLFADFIALPENTLCADGTFLVQAVNYRNPGSEERSEEVTAHLPGSRAAFPMYIWREEFGG